jgi:hypothetical protein
MIIREILNVGRAMAQIEVQIMTFVIMRVFSSSLLHPPSSARVHKICNGKGAVTSVHAIKPFLTLRLPNLFLNFSTSCM